MSEALRRWAAAVIGAVALMFVVPGVAFADTVDQRSTSPDPSPTTQIIGGHQATQQYSWIASLQSNGRHFCTGSLVDPQWVLTARHCVRNGAGFSVRVGSNDQASGGTLVRAVRVVRHYSSDIALVQLSSAVPNQPVQIASSAQTGSPTTILGWGQTCPTRGCGGIPRYLQALDTQLVPDDRCSGISGSAEICVDGGNGRGACYGDSGGPAITNGMLVGATSRSGYNSPTCALGPTIYTDVPAHAGWIQRYTG